jgi:hypothetical protein
VSEEIVGVVEKRPRGRPRGARLNKKARWQPKKWDPLFDQMVALSCTGMSNVAIAARFDYTPQQICNILTSDQGKLIKSLVSKHIQEELKKSLELRITRTEARAHEIISAVLNDNELLVKNPIALYDRAIKFLEGRGQLEDKSRVQVSERTVVIPSDLVEKLVSGISKANDAVLLHGNTEVRRISDGSDKRVAP